MASGLLATRFPARSFMKPSPLPGVFFHGTGKALWYSVPDPHTRSRYRIYLRLIAQLSPSGLRDGSGLFSALFDDPNASPTCRAFDPSRKPQVYFDSFVYRVVANRLLRDWQARLTLPEPERMVIFEALLRTEARRVEFISFEFVELSLAGM